MGLVSARERRQEIGVRRALGATKRAIFVGFPFEGLAITLSGVVVGTLAGGPMHVAPPARRSPKGEGGRPKPRAPSPEPRVPSPESRVMIDPCSSDTTQ